MPTLLIDNGKDRLGGTFHGPLLIGRRAANAIVVDDPQVELVHSWIASDPRGYFVTNISQTGETYVNGVAVQGRQPLRDGDVIEVGSALHITYRSDALLPLGYRPIELMWRGAAVANVDEPVTFPCGTCRTMIRVTPVFSGSMSRCPACGRVVDVPYESVLPKTPEPEAQPQPEAPAPIQARAPEPEAPPAPQAPPAPLVTAPEPAQVITPPEPDAPMAAPIVEPTPAPPEPVAIAQDKERVEPVPEEESPPPAQAMPPEAAPIEAAPPAEPIAPLAPAPAHVEETVPTDENPPQNICGICHTAIEPSDETTNCPDCGLAFHFECWMANWGCSSYGCSQVNAAKPQEKGIQEAVPPSPPSPKSEPATPPHTPSARPAPVDELGVSAAPPAIIGETPSFDTLTQSAQEHAAHPLRPASGSAVPIPDLPLGEPADEFPWEYVALAANALALLLSMLMFGIPSLAALLGTYQMSRHRGYRHFGILVLCVILGFVGILAGIGVSYFWWLAPSHGGRR